ncbi:ATP-binding cassette domain-containing protein [Marivirga sp. S37H4]|uniref:ATP-binding cassette domain-containing protein n=1 Tax=Marivirga aurantiaca TaxID=2802615 RepID=A0A934X0L7_9BACT|nr:ATP-binding cassette domain-containing protein [Marivirga aurantiaca]MBK6266733.1 ATP-binding cassette domain-containing protein [Marivirga aurantiaca]
MASETSIHPLKRFIALLKPEKKLVLTIYIYAIFAGLVSLTLPLGIQAIINLILGGQVSTSWIVLVALVIIGVIVFGFLQVRQLSINEILQQKIFTRASFEFAYRIPKFKLDQIKGTYLPELINRFFDTASIQKGLSKILIDFTTAFFQIVFGLLLISFYHPFFILFSIFLVILIFLIVRFTFPKGLETSIIESHHKYATAHWLEELARNVETFKMASDSKLPLEKNDENTEAYIKARRSHFNVLKNQYNLLIIFKAVVTAGLLLIGGLLVFQQQMNIGQFVAAEIIIILIINSVEKMIFTLESIYDILTSVDKLAVVTDLPLEDMATGYRDFKVDEEGIEVKLKNLTLAQNGSTHKFLNNITLDIKPGEKICLTGTSNAGKTIILQLLAGWFDFYEGNISFNGVPLQDINLTQLRKKIGDCMSTEGIFHGTVAENLSMGVESISFDELQEACEVTGLSEYLESEPSGFQKILFPGDKTLPKRAKQQLLWARGILGNKSLILWEDAFGMVSYKEKLDFVKYLTNSKKTVVLVSNNMDVIEKCDRVIGMEKGKLLYDIPGLDAKNHNWFQEIALSKNA